MLAGVVKKRPASRQTVADELRFESKFAGGGTVCPGASSSGIHRTDEAEGNLCPAKKSLLYPPLTKIRTLTAPQVSHKFGRFGSKLVVDCPPLPAK